MNARHHSWLKSGTALLLVAVQLLTGCAPTPPPAIALSPTPAPASIDYVRHPAQPFWDGQVIVTGSRADIATILSASGVQFAPEKPLLEEIDLNFNKPFTPPAGVPEAFAGTSDLVIQLYALDPGMDVIDAVVLIDTTARASNKAAVFADPNYFTGYDPTSADPWTIGGDPWTIGGDPSAPPGATAPNDLFWRQWAFGPDGVILNATPGGSAETREVVLGDATTVAVFDTSPFEADGERHFVVEGWPSLAYGPLRLDVSHFRDLPGVLDRDHAHNIGDHGLFVSGLAYGVAPRSQIHLIQTLNQEGQGDLFSLLANLAHYAMTASPGTDPLQLSNTVVNLSLGVAESRDMKDALERESLVEWIRGLLQDSRFGEPDEWAGAHTPIAALQTLLPILNEAGAVLVAASGNDAAGTSGAGRPAPQLPASYIYVIGVGASTQNGSVACFSNEGDLYAPGGDGGYADGGTPYPDPGCAPMLQHCSTSQDCEYGLISMIESPGRDGYAFWTGTSFAAPLVSGMAALALQSGIAPRDVPEYVLSLREGDVVKAPPEWRAP